MLIIFFLAAGIGIISPLIRRANVFNGIMALSSCAVSLLLFAVYVYLAARPEIVGLAASATNRNEAVAIAIFELPVLVLSLLSLRRSHLYFWAGWAINLLFTLYWAYIVIVLMFFWHW